MMARRDLSVARPMIARRDQSVARPRARRSRSATRPTRSSVRTTAPPTSRTRRFSRRRAAASSTRRCASPAPGARQGEGGLRAPARLKCCMHFGRACAGHRELIRRREEENRLLNKQPAAHARAGATAAAAGGATAATAGAASGSPVRGPQGTGDDDDHLVPPRLPRESGLLRGHPQRAAPRETRRQLRSQIARRGARRATRRAPRARP